MKSFDRLVKTIETLRSENGCPWDKKQTMSDMKRYLIEEVYELCDAIELKDESKISEETGDVLLNLLLISTILKESGNYNIDDILDNLDTKITSRHPHVFGTEKAGNTAEALRHWHASKKTNEGKSLFGDIPVSAPAMSRAYTISKRADKIGFGFDDTDQLIAKIKEELTELENAVKLKSKADIENETGDLFFTLVNMCVFFNIYPEDTLKNSCEKFLKRFRYIEERLGSNGKDFFQLKREDIEKIWTESKD